MSLHHKNGGNCEHCSYDLERTHPHLVEWFWWVKSNHPHAHIAWSFRDQEEQDSAYAHGMSRKKWPHSKHNALDSDGEPCSKALDIFEIGDDGKAGWDIPFYAIVNKETIDKGYPIRWGGDFELLKDFNHFELREEGD